MSKGRGLRLVAVVSCLAVVFGCMGPVEVPGPRPGEIGSPEPGGSAEAPRESTRVPVPAERSQPIPAAPPVASSVVVERSRIERRLRGVEGVGDVIGLRPSVGLTGLHGIEVTGIPAGSPATEFGLQRGDVVTSVNGIDLTSLQNATGLAEALVDATRFEAVVNRNGEEVRLLVQLR